MSNVSMQRCGRACDLPVPKLPDACSPCRCAAGHMQAFQEACALHPTTPAAVMNVRQHVMAVATRHSECLSLQRVAYTLPSLPPTSISAALCLRWMRRASADISASPPNANVGFAAADAAPAAAASTSYDC